MHFKLGLYEHQSAGALEGAISALAAGPRRYTLKGTGKGSERLSIFVDFFQSGAP